MMGTKSPRTIGTRPRAGDPSDYPHIPIQQLQTAFWFDTESWPKVNAVPWAMLTRRGMQCCLEFVRNTRMNVLRMERVAKPR